MHHDLKLAWRRLRRAPGFALAAVVTLALAVGANTAIFTVADAVLFRPLPYRDPDRLYLLRRVDPANGLRSSGVAFEYVEAIQQRHGGVAGVGLRSPAIMTTQAGSEGAEFVETLIAASDYFEVLGVQPARGRLFNSADVGSQAAVLTFEAWRNRFGGDESIVGRELTLGRNSHTVIGILPPRFIFPTASQFFGSGNTGRAEYVTVADHDPGFVIHGDAVVRLKPGVTREQAQAELDVLVAGIPAPNPRFAGHPIVLDDMRAVLFPTGRQVLVLLLVSAGFVLLIGCANLANMLLARTQSRERELAIHAALGAGRLRLMRPVFFETLIIGAAAAAVALAVTLLTFDALQREVPRLAYGRAFLLVDLRVAGFALLLGIAGGALFAVIPAWRASQSRTAALIRPGSQRTRRTWTGLARPMVSAQVALAIVLIAGAVTAARQLLAVLDEPLGFDPENLIALQVRSGLEGSAVRDFFDGAVAAIERRGDVLSAGAGASSPFDRFSGNEVAVVAAAKVPVVHVLPGYLETLGVRLVDGRLPRREDTAQDLEPAVMTISAARMHAPGGRAVGDTLTLPDGRAVRIIGVIADVTRNADAKGASVYVVPRNAQPRTVIVRTRTRSQSILVALRREVVALAPPTAPVNATWTSDTIAGASRYRDPRFQTLVSGAFAVLGLGLAALGIFAVVAATIAVRTREIGVRLAIGASPRALVRLMVLDAIVPIAVGIALGAAATQLIRGVVQARVAGLEAANLDALGIASLTMLVAGLLAAYIPARRVTRIDPILVLRAE